MILFKCSYVCVILDNILKKSPEVDDVFDLIKEHSANWYDLAIELKIDENTRTTLHNDARLTNHGKLERILQKWHQAQPSDVTWEKILEVLESMMLRRTARKVKMFLEKPNVIEKYRKKPDFELLPYERKVSEQENKSLSGKSNPKEINIIIIHSLMFFII